MTSASLLGILVEMVFGLIFLGALAGYLHRRDLVSRDVALTFSPFVGILITSVWSQVWGAPPGLLSAVAGILFFLQPLFALHLASLVHRVPRAVLISSVVFLVASFVPALVIRPVPTVAGLIPLGAFVIIEGVAAAFLLLEARRRTGPGARRLGIAAAATALFAVALLIVGTGAASTDLAATTTVIGLLVALCAAIGYVAAFLPPAAVRHIWQAGTTVEYQHALLERSGESVEAIWRQFAAFASAVTGGSCVVTILRPDGAMQMVGSPQLGLRRDDVALPHTHVGRLAESAYRDESPSVLPEGSHVRTVAEDAGARFLSTVSIESGAARIALVILSAHRSLFHASDLDLLATIGAQTAVVAERRAILADQEATSARLAQTVEALRSASQAKSDFLASMSHELRTPLSAILGFSDLMRQGEATDGHVAVPLEWVEHIHRGGEHLLALINDVLDLSKVEAGRVELRRERIELGSAIGELLEGVRPLAERKALHLVADVPAITIWADRGRFRQVMYNLLSNAIKFTSTGGEVRVEVRDGDGEVHVTVADTGVGIAPEDLTHVFEEFRQVGALSAREGGTGLGLALARRLVEAHGGRIELDSVIGRGSRFTVSLPAFALDAGAAAPEPVIPAGAAWLSRAGAEPGNQAGVAAALVSSIDDPDVLVIEDDPSALRLLREYLQPLGYSVRAAPDGEHGLALARERPPAAIILDILLPTIDGWEVLRRLKDDPGLRDIPVIVVTVVDEREIGLALGATDYLVKPIQRSALVGCLERTIPSSQDLGRRRRILAVDDEPASLAFIAATLEGEGYDVVQATGGRQGVDRAREGAFDLVVCDLVMPDLDGFGVITALKANRTTAEIPIVICTARELSEDDRLRLHGQVLAIVTKGVDARDGLRAWLEQAALRKGPGVIADA
jgi:signal transduction histidine kinase/CheY-like chemotaxis protein